MVRPALQEMNVQQQQLVIQALHLQDSGNLSHQREYFCKGPGNCESRLALGKRFWAWCVYPSRMWMSITTNCHPNALPA